MMTNASKAIQQSTDSWRGHRGNGVRSGVGDCDWGWGCVLDALSDSLFAAENNLNNVWLLEVK